ncbi:hypothetical protein Q8F55_007569 [Vanrija albida]|uniref:Nucleolar pre-ribosomal-associated protein 1 C-terminal domain-containing protein n=1 Tax=Vanrija albida TaxID=181172 RepID=A0ABR3PTY2_9TREE
MANSRAKGRADAPQKAQGPGYQPELWQNTIDAAVQNGLVDIALLTISTLLDAHYLPSPHNAQLLLYLASQATTSATAPSPLAILQHLQSLHAPPDVAGLIPHIVPKRERIKRGHDSLPPWFLWVHKDAESPVKGRTRLALSPLERDVERAVRGCVDEGVWDMLWADAPESDDDEEEEEEEEGDTRRRGLKPGAWDVLGFLTSLWTAPAAYTDGKPTLFLQQLKKPYADRMADDASAPLAIVRLAFLRKTAQPLPETIQRREIAARLVGLLFDAAAAPAAFLPSALRSGLLQLVRHAPAQQLRLFLSAVGGAHWAALAHVLTHAVEDAAGVRTDPGRERLRRMGPGELGAPSVGYALDVIALSAARPEARERAAVLRAALLMLLVKHTPHSAAWARAGDEKYATAAADGDAALAAVLSLAARKATAA